MHVLRIKRNYLQAVDCVYAAPAEAEHAGCFLHLGTCCLPLNGRGEMRG